MKQELILITGASGCVGQYIATWLIENSNAQLLLWLRDPKKLTAINTNNPRIKLLIGDLREPECFKEDLSKVSRVIHTATAWGDPKRAYEVNVIAVKNLFKMLNPKIIKQIIYFSTASVLDKNLNPLKEAFTYGTEYIQTKAQCLSTLESHPLVNKIIAVFPTLVFGGQVYGKSSFPTSYLTEGLNEAFKWIWLARWLKANSKFHFIHAADIGFICGHLATNDHYIGKTNSKSKLRKIVLAQPSITIDQAIQTLLKWRKMKKSPQIPLSPFLVQLLIKILPIKVNQWDKFSIKQWHFIHSPITTPESLGGESFAPTLSKVIENSGLSREKKTKMG